MSVKIALSNAFIARPILKSSNCGAKVEVRSSRDQGAAIGMKIRWRELRVGCGFTCGWGVEELTEVNVERGEVNVVFRRMSCEADAKAGASESGQKSKRSDKCLRLGALIRSGGGGSRFS